MAKAWFAALFLVVAACGASPDPDLADDLPPPPNAPTAATDEGEQATADDQTDDRDDDRQSSTSDETASADEQEADGSEGSGSESGVSDGGGTGGGGSEDNTPAPPPDAPSTGADLAFVAAAGPTQAVLAADQLVNVVTSAVLCATYLNGGSQFTFAGTLTFDQAGFGCNGVPFPVSYDANPGGQLVVVDANGFRSAFEISTFEVFASWQPAEVLGQNHQIGFVAGGDAPPIAVRRDSIGGQRSTTIDGNLLVGEIATGVQLFQRTNGSFESSFGGADTLEFADITGTMTAAQTTIEVEETRRFEMVCFENDCATAIDRSISTSWSANGRYELTGSLSQSLRNGRVSEPNRWFGSAVALFRDGQPVGGLGHVESSTGVQLSLQSEQGSYVLGSFR